MPLNLWAITRTALAALFLTTAPALADDLAGHVASVHDGDTFRLEDGTRIRLWGIDTPELEQTCLDAAGSPYLCGVDARRALLALISDRPVSCERKGKSYNRVVAQCEVDGADLGAMLVATGRAVEDPRYSSGFYTPQQDQARDARLGLWAGHFLAPAEWRKRYR